MGRSKQRPEAACIWWGEGCSIWQGSTCRVLAKQLSCEHSSCCGLELQHEPTPVLANRLCASCCCCCRALGIHAGDLSREVGQDVAATLLVKVAGEWVDWVTQRLPQHMHI